MSPNHNLVTPFMYKVMFSSAALGSLYLKFTKMYKNKTRSGS